MSITTEAAYRTSDGTRFFDLDKAIAYEGEQKAIAYIVEKIPDSRLRHGTYAQHDREFLLQLKRDLWPHVLRKVNAEKNYPSWIGTDPDTVLPMSVVGRVLDDYGGPVSHAWSSLARFNFALGREYDQPFFALNPDKAEPA